MWGQDSCGPWASPAMEALHHPFISVLNHLPAAMICSFGCPPAALPCPAIVSAHAGSVQQGGLPVPPRQVRARCLGLPGLPPQLLPPRGCVPPQALHGTHGQAGVQNGTHHHHAALSCVHVARVFAEPSQTCLRVCACVCALPHGGLQRGSGPPASTAVRQQPPEAEAGVEEEMVTAPEAERMRVSARSKAKRPFISGETDQVRPAKAARL